MKPEFNNKTTITVIKKACLIKTVQYVPMLFGRVLTHPLHPGV